MVQVTYGAIEGGTRPLPTGSQRRKLVVVAGALCLAAVAAVALVTYSAAGRTSLESSGNAEIRALRALQESDSLLREADASRVRRAKREVAAVQPVQRRLTGAAKIKFEAQQLEHSALRRGRKAHAAQLRTRRFSRLDGEDDEEVPVLGPLAVSKWVPGDHPEGHKDCPLDSKDCDELWPWGKVRPRRILALARSVCAHHLSEPRPFPTPTVANLQHTPTPSPAPVDQPSLACLLKNTGVPRS